MNTNFFSFLLVLIVFCVIIAVICNCEMIWSIFLYILDIMTDHFVVSIALVIIIALFVGGWAGFIFGMFTILEMLAYREYYDK